MMQKILIDFKDVNGNLNDVKIIPDCNKIVNKNASYF